jgi:hypothetical protein
MSNPLRRYDPQAEPRRALNWHEIADDRNRNMSRRDVEWRVNANGDGIHLRWRESRPEASAKWVPTAAEIEATRNVVNRAIAANISQAQWDGMVMNGTISREVDKVMRANVGQVA